MVVVVLNVSVTWDNVEILVLVVTTVEVEVMGGGVVVVSCTCIQGKWRCLYQKDEMKPTYHGLILSQQG
jgi:hypothetical protein